MLVLAACAPQTGGDEAAHVHAGGSAVVVLDGPAAVRSRFDGGAARFVHPEGRPVAQLGVALDLVAAGTPAPVRVRGLADDGAPGPWIPLEITWSEGALHVGRAILPAPAAAIEVEGGADWRAATLELYPEVRAGSGPLARDLALEVAAAPDGRGELRQALAPADLVIPRAAWGARDPGRICGQVVAPYRMSIHHTAGPVDDGPDPAARMRQIQAYHIDNNGWCDIGYHFVVSQSGLIFQGRSDERRPGAHVANQNHGNVGISLIGNFQNQQVGEAQMAATARIVGWVHRTYDIALDRSRVRGHREWPGQGTACPGNNLLARLDELLDRAGRGGEPPPPPPPPQPIDVGFRVGWVDPPADRDPEGSSAGIPDLLPGEAIQAEVVVHNASDRPIRGVELGYWFEAPYLRATHYVIQTDHPALDQATWRVNDADAAEGNPPKDAMGPEGALIMYAFSPGETKRVLIDLEAGPYSVGAADHPDVRAWIRRIDDVYVEQAGWDAAPAVNRTTSERLQGFAQVDVLGVDQWSFEGGQPDDREGWRPCPAPADPGALSVESSEGPGRLVLPDTAPGACVVSPPWTAIDAGAWDAVVLRVRTDAGPHEIELTWARDGEEPASDRSVRVAARGDGTFETLVIPVGTHEAWTGTATRLWLTPFAGDDPAAPFEIDAVWAQSQARRESASEREGFADPPPADLLEDAPDPPDPPPPPVDDPVPDAGPTKPPPASSPPLPARPEERLEGSPPLSARHEGGCRTAPAPTPVHPAALLLLLAAIPARRRRAR